MVGACQRILDLVSSMSAVAINSGGGLRSAFPGRPNKARTGASPWRARPIAGVTCAAPAIFRRADRAGRLAAAMATSAARMSVDGSSATGVAAPRCNGIHVRSNDCSLALKRAQGGRSVMACGAAEHRARSLGGSTVQLTFIPNVEEFRAGSPPSRREFCPPQAKRWSAHARCPTCPSGRAVATAFCSTTVGYCQSATEFGGATRRCCRQFVYHGGAQPSTDCTTALSPQGVNIVAAIVVVIRE